jgi:hypothetical protein
MHLILDKIPFPFLRLLMPKVVCFCVPNEQLKFKNFNFHASRIYYEILQ